MAEANQEEQPKKSGIVKIILFIFGGVLLIVIGLGIGYFLFGGSTVIVCGEPGKWKPSSDILANSEQGIETYIKLGDEVAELARS